MRACTFFGHRECPDSIRPALKSVIEDLIVNHNVERFYVGNQGQFDALVRCVLRDLCAEYPQIDYAVVLAYLPGEKAPYRDDSDTIFPEGMECVPPRYAISKRNAWMLKRCEYVVAYVNHTWGGAAKYTQQAQAQGKTVIHLGNMR